MPTRAEHTDIAVIGAGPIGIELAAALRLGGADFIHVEAGQIGSTIEWWAPGTRFFSSPERIEIAGMPLVTPEQDKATREEYLAYLRGVVRHYDLDVRAWRRVVHLAKDDGAFEIGLARSSHGVGGPAEMTGTAAGAVAPSSLIRANRVVLAIGDMHRPRMLDVPGEELPHVSHHLADPHTYFRGRVLIVGGKNSAVEAAIRLSRAGASVAMSYRGAAFDEKRVKYWLRPELEWLISKGRVEFFPETTVTRIREGHVELSGTGDGGRFGVAADFVLLLTGYEQDPGLFRRIGVSLAGENLAPQFDPETMETGVEGVYVAGTAAAGSQRRARVFIENSHVHVARIARALTGVEPPWKSGDEYTALAEA
jgi:thioredoxin reductase (NADPH)